MHRIHSVLMKKSTGVPVVLLPAIWFLPVSMMDAGWKSVVAHRLMTASTRRPAENIDQSADHYHWQVGPVLLMAVARLGEKESKPSMAETHIASTSLRIIMRAGAPILQQLERALGAKYAHEDFVTGLILGAITAIVVYVIAIWLGS